jgi:hypothetical protein
MLCEVVWLKLAKKFIVRLREIRQVLAKLPRKCQAIALGGLLFRDFLRPAPDELTYRLESRLLAMREQRGV